MDTAYHYRKAEELAAKAHEYLGHGDGQDSALVWAAVAQVHATLATATAAAALATPPADAQPLSDSLSHSALDPQSGLTPTIDPQFPQRPHKEATDQP